MARPVTLVLWLAGCATASAACSPLPTGGTTELPGDLSLACTAKACSALVSGVHLADVAVTPGARLCDTTSLHVEDALPRTCDAAVRRTGVSIRQDGRNGSGASEVVLDVLKPAEGLPWVGSTRPLKACLPHYAEKRGDVWQHAWRGEARDLLFQVFEEDESRAGRGNSRKGATAPKPFVTTVAPRFDPHRAVTTRPTIGRPVERHAPDADRF